MKRIFALITIFSFAFISAQENATKFPYGLETIPAENPSEVPTFQQVQDSIAANQGVWTWDQPNGNMTIEGANGIGNTGQALFAVGNGAGDGNATYGTTAIGYNSLKNQTRNYNIGIGTQAGENNLGGSNILLGYQTGQNLRFGNVIAIGNNAAKGHNWSSIPLGSAIYDIAIGENAYGNPTKTGNSVFHGGGNIHIGYLAGEIARSSFKDVYIGYNAGRNVGNSATGSNQFSGNNVGIGVGAFRDGRGMNNVVIGGGYVDGTSTPTGAGRGLIGNDNVVLGNWAGYGVVGNGNIMAGYSVEPSLAGSLNLILNPAGTISGSQNRNTILNANYGTSSKYSVNVNSSSNRTVIGHNFAIFGNGTDRKMSIYPTASATPAEPRERLDIGTDGYMAGKGMKLDNSTFQVTVDAQTLSANQTQKLQNASGTIALVEKSREVAVLNITESVSISSSASFNVPLFDVCPLIEPNYIDWEITWTTSGKLHKFSSASKFTGLTLDTTGGCLNIAGLSDDSINFGPLNSPKLVLRY